MATPWPFDPGFATVADGTAPDRAAAGGPAAAGWQVEGDRAGITVENGTLRLRNDDPEGGVGVRQLWQLGPGRAAHLPARRPPWRSDAIQGTRHGFRVGEVTLVADADIERPYFHRCTGWPALRGTRARRATSSISRFPGAARQVELAIRLRHATGELRGGQPASVAALGERPGFAPRARRAADRLGRDAGGRACWLFGRGVDHRGSALALALAGAGGRVLLLMPEGLRDSTLLRLADLAAAQRWSASTAWPRRPLPDLRRAGFLVRLSRRARPLARASSLLLVGLAGLVGAAAVPGRAALADAGRLARQRAGRRARLAAGDGLAVVASGGAVRDAAPLLDHRPAAGRRSSACNRPRTASRADGRAARALAEPQDAGLALGRVGALADLIVDPGVGAALVLRQDRALGAGGELARAPATKQASRACVARGQAPPGRGVQRARHLERGRRARRPGAQAATASASEQRQGGPAAAGKAAGPAAPRPAVKPRPLDRALGHHLDQVRAVLGAGVEVRVEPAGVDAQPVDRGGREVPASAFSASAQRNAVGAGAGDRDPHRRRRSAPRTRRPSSSGWPGSGT